MLRTAHLAEKRQHFLAHLKTAYRDATVVCSDPSGPAGFARLLDALYAENWDVYCKPPFAGPELVLDYLGTAHSRGAEAALGLAWTLARNAQGSDEIRRLLDAAEEEA